MEKEQLKELFKKYHEGKCTEEEKALLEAWYLQFNEHDLDITPKRIKAIGNRIFRELPGNHTTFLKIGVRLLSAATIIGIIITLTIRILFPIGKPESMLTRRDIAPGTNTAVLTLSNGKRINLSKAGTGQLASQSGIRIYKTTSGQITYKTVGNSERGHANTINNISTPKGGQWQVVLPDGSKVWLNSASSFNFPASFENQKERIVQLSGEAYFEVAKDKLHPFIVKTDKESVQVLGTHFNINSYPDEPAVKTTLAEGRIKVTDLAGETKQLVPGKESVLRNGSLTIADANVEEALAWKNGYFRFNDEKIQSVMRQLARWYDVDIKYAGNVPTDGFNGKVSRSKNISQVLKALEATQTVHFKVEGRRVTVMK
ncbi:FecR family protein [Mucilaginibacter sp. KACC 22773]|uniref:FecR family protein n=1 Tax=Mucilaginibacter sp. KACC 22773 TaxID=3025671 RepID=UPI002366A727|nr:FecR family protein [Mucilaginibacter sp. KACC 22773]WDF78959.1 FecR family protein [Mucilaginibacter sp. KACC 22773]